MFLGNVLINLQKQKGSLYKVLLCFIYENREFK